MPRFEIYFDRTLIGASDLELGDPPMGVAFGKLLVSCEYTPHAATPEAQSHLSVRLTNGPALAPAGGVCIADYSRELGSGAVEVSVLGIDYPEYEKLFPEHVASYEKKFPRGG